MAGRFGTYRRRSIDSANLKLSGTMTLDSDLDDDEVYLLVKADRGPDKIGEDVHGAYSKTTFAKGRTIMLVPDTLRDKVVKELKHVEDERNGTPALPGVD